jgi:hypothetical protein
MNYENHDVEELLHDIKKNVELIYVQTRYQEIKKVVVKNTLENMRSILDYVSQDLVQRISQITEIKNTKIYFPYGKDMSLFENSLKRNSFDQLINIFPEIYQIVLKQQPFICNDNWLTDLCNLTIEAKHNNLLQSKRHLQTDITQPGFLHAPNARDVASYGNVMIDASGKTTLLDDVFVDGQGNATVHRKSGTTMVIQQNRLFFDGKNIEIKLFFGNCIDKLNILYSDLQQANWSPAN